MAAVGIFRGRLTLSCLRRNFHLPGVTSTRKFFINTTYGKKTVSGAQCSSFRQKVRICAAIDRVGRDRKLSGSQLEAEAENRFGFPLCIYLAGFLSLFLFNSSAIVYAGESDEAKENNEMLQRHKGCFTSKRQEKKLKNLARAREARAGSLYKQQQPEEDDFEPPRKISTRSRQVRCL